MMHVGQGFFRGKQKQPSPLVTFYVRLWHVYVVLLPIYFSTFSAKIGLKIERNCTCSFQEMELSRKDGKYFGP